MEQSGLHAEPNRNSKMSGELNLISKVHEKSKTFKYSKKKNNNKTVSVFTLTKT